MKQPENDTLEHLLQAIANDDQKAFRCFYDRFYPQVYRFVRYFLSYGSDCDDVVSDVFCIIWYNRKKICHIQHIEAWLYITCRNEAWRFLRQQDKYHTISIDEMPIDLVVHADSVEDKLIEEEMFELFKDAVNSLPARCKLVFLMSREEKLKNKEIARILNITEGTVEQQMHIAIQKIVRFVKKYDSDFCARNVIKLRKTANK